jgi:hypothetical protein
MFPNPTQGTGSAASQGNLASKIRNTLIEVSGIARANGSLILSKVGSIAIEPAMVPVLIDPGSGMVTFALSWEIPLEEPDAPRLSLELDAQKVSNSGNVRLIQYRDRPYMGFQVENPAPGNWNLTVSSVDKQHTEVKFRLFVFNQNPRITGGFILSRQAHKPGDTVIVRFQCCFDRPLTNLAVIGTVTPPGGENITIEFTEGKNPGDGRLGNGLYSSSLQNTSIPGIYTIKILAISDDANVKYADLDGPPGGKKYDYDPIPSFRREFTTTIVIGEPLVRRVDVEPNGGYPGQKLQVKLKGNLTNFMPASTTFDFGEGINVSDIKVENYLTASATITIDRTATLGSRSITATTAKEIVKTVEGFQVVRRKWVWSEKLLIRLLWFLIGLLIILLLIMTRFFLQ